MLSDEEILILDILHVDFPIVFLTHSLSLDLYLNPSSFSIALSAFIKSAPFKTTNEKNHLSNHVCIPCRTFIDREVSFLVYIWATFTYAL